jgi:hypothetical protein
MRNNLEVRILIWKLLRSAAWAPLAVLIFHAVAAHIGIRERLDWLMHLLGGIAAAFFFYQTFRLFSKLIDALPVFIVYLLSFSLTCAIAVFWEFGEFFSDQVWQTHAQQSLAETMQDLIFGVMGAMLFLAMLFFSSLIWSRWQKYPARPE